MCCGCGHKIKNNSNNSQGQQANPGLSQTNWTTRLTGTLSCNNETVPYSRSNLWVSAFLIQVSGLAQDRFQAVRPQSWPSIQRDVQPRVSPLLSWVCHVVRKATGGPGTPTEAPLMKMGRENSVRTYLGPALRVFMEPSNSSRRCRGNIPIFRGGNWRKMRK